MLISPSHKFIFFKPLKCAGSSVEYNLLQECGEDALCTGGTSFETQKGYRGRNNLFVEEGEEKIRFHSHTWPDLFFERIRNLNSWEDYKKITIVRNPWDAVVSWYWWTISEKKQNEWLKIKEEDSKIEAQWKFESFLNLMSSHDSIRPEALKINCTALDYIAQTNELFVDDSIDHYIRFENVQIDYDSLCGELGIEKSKLARFKTGQRKIKRHYSEYYTEVSRDSIFMRFPKLIQKFNYRFDRI